MIFVKDLYGRKYEEDHRLKQDHELRKLPSHVEHVSQGIDEDQVSFLKFNIIGFNYSLNT